jgi:hypothetical protein
MSYLARGSMQLGSGAPSRDGDRTAESSNGAAIPLRRNPDRIPDISGPLLRRVRRPASAGIDSKANRASRRHRDIAHATDVSRAAG